MDADEARNDLEQARRSYSASVRPPLPLWVPPACGLMVGAAVALAGLAPASIWWRLAAVAAAVGLAVLARALVLGIRARQGVRGLRGPVLRTQATLIVTAAAFLVSALGSTAEIRWLYVAMGAVIAVVVWAMLQRKVRQ